MSTVGSIGSEAWCRQAYLNYHCYGNSMGITAAQMGEIVTTWKDKISSWQNSVANDETEYEFDDSDYAAYIQEGKDTAKETTGHDGKTGGQIASGIGTVGAGGIGFHLSGGTEVVKNWVSTGFNAVKGYFAKQTAQKMAEKSAKLVADNAISQMKEIRQGISMNGGLKSLNSNNVAGTQPSTPSTSSTQPDVSGTQSGADSAAQQGSNKASVSTYVAAALSIATAVKYRFFKKGNEDAKKACDELQGQMTSAQQLLHSTQKEMGCYGDKLTELSDKAFTYNEETNEKLKIKQAEYEMNLESLATIQAKIEAGEELTPEEKQNYEELVGFIQELGVQIEELTVDTTDEVAALYEEMGAYQDGFDTAAATMGEIEGLTEFAESFDKTTQTMCYVEAVGQTLNVATAASTAAKLFALGPWNWALGAAVAAAGVSSGVAALEQKNWAGEVGTEIDLREQTQDINSETMDVYDEQIDYFAGYMEGVEDLELEVPDDIVPPEGSDAPTGGDGDSPGVPTGGSDGGDPDKKPKTPPVEE